MPGSNEAASRKDDHLRLAAEQHQHEAANDFDRVRIIHQSLPDTAVNEVSLEVPNAVLPWAVPFYINGMTGGSDSARQVNQVLARAAARTGVAMASGSESVAVRHPELRESFRVIREENPSGLVLGNVGAAVGVDAAVAAVRLLDADGLQVHLNVPQEIVMPEGDRDFRGIRDNIAQIVDAVEVPVIVKEVGFGMSYETVQSLVEIGVRAVDVGGRGGTNFATIENARRPAEDYSYLADWGQSAVESLIDCAEWTSVIDVNASGGVRTPLDVLKALILGARAVGVAGHFLQIAVNGGEDALVAEIERWKAHLASLMAMVGVTSVADLPKVRHTVRAH